MYINPMEVRFMKRHFFVGLVLVFSVFLLCAISSRSEATTTSLGEIDASNIGIKAFYKVADIPNWSAWGTDKDGFAGSFAYSPDGRYLLYNKVLAKHYSWSQIVIVNVANRKIEKVINASGNNPVWSPDGQRIFACEKSGGFSIYEIKSGKHTKVGTSVPCSEDNAVWYMNEKILFLKMINLQGGELKVDENPQVLDLNSLSFTSISTEEASKVVKEFIPNSLGKAHFFQEDGTLQIINDDSSFTKILFFDLNWGHRYALSPKYDSIAFSKQDGLYLAYLDTNFKTEMNYSVDSFRDSLPDDLKSAYTSFMSRNELLTGEVYAPKINPLTGKVVGPEGKAKGTVKIIGESNGKVVVQKIFERTPFKVGVDVLSDIKAPEHLYINDGKVRFELKIWPTLQRTSDKELEAIKEDRQKQVADAATEAKEWFEKGLQLIKAGDRQGAIDAYSKAIELDPKYVNAYGERGFAYAKSGDYEQAIADFSKAIELAPKLALAYEMRGLAYDRMLGLDDYQKAIQDWKTAAKLGSKKAQDILRSKGIQW